MESNRTDITDFKSNDVVRDALEAVTFEDISKMVRDYCGENADAAFKREGKGKHRMTQLFDRPVDPEDPDEKVLLHPRAKLQQVLWKAWCDDSISGIDLNISEVLMNLEERLWENSELNLRNKPSIDEAEFRKFPTLNGLLVCARKAVAQAILDDRNAA
ncbi:MAG: hypothetical protein PHO48_02200 [Candidatus Gracilibacteria bacterium]|nr:hypothetical protein [Candidatus Gracilibacteria bacterium]MDD5178868.1 hypothetical protein [Candidatus Gracilibacteria bacterium]